LERCGCDVVDKLSQNVFDLKKLSQTYPQ